MSYTVQDGLKFVNEQIAFHEDRERQFSGQARARKHSETKEKFHALADLLQELESAATADKAAPKQLSLSLTPEDIEGLPDELMEELTISKDKTEFLILSALEKNHGVASLDQLLVALYRESGEIFKRSALNNRIYRMVTRGQVFSVPDKKGVYSLEELNPGDLDEMVAPGRRAKARDSAFSDSDENFAGE